MSTQAISAPIDETSLMVRNTTHTIQHRQPSVLASLPFNKAAQFGVGLVIIIVTIKAWWAGWFSVFAFRYFEQPLPEEGMGTPIGLLPFLIDAVCLVGIAGFAIVGLVRGAVGPLFGNASEWIAEHRAKRAAMFTAESVASEVAVEDAVNDAKASLATDPEPREPEKPKNRSLDPDKVLRQFKKHSKRLEALEELHPELKPAEPLPPPTNEELAQQVAELQAALKAKSVDVAKPIQGELRGES